MQKSKLKNEDKSSNWLIALLQGAREDFRNLHLIHFIPLLLMLLIAFAWSQEYQRIDLALASFVNFPIVVAINSGHLYLFLYLLLMLTLLVILFVRARRILLLVSPIAICVSVLFWAGTVIGANVITTDSIIVNNHRYYVSRIDNKFRSIVADGIYVIFEPTYFVVVHKCDKQGVNCTTVFEDYQSDLSRGSPILEFETNNNQLLIRRTGSDYDGFRTESTDFTAVIEDNLDTTTP